MIKTFYNFLTYNPYNVQISEVMIPTMVSLIIISVCIYALICFAKQRLSLKDIAVSIVYSPYILLSILWQICFIDESIFVCLVPIYPLIALFFVMRVYKRKKSKLNFKEYVTAPMGETTVKKEEYNK